MTLLGQRQVVAFEVYALLAEAALSAEVGRGAEARERQKVANQVRLVEIPALHRQPSPV